MEIVKGKYFLRDYDLRENYEFDGSFIETGINLYEVVRVTNGIILFLEDHLARLNNSVKNLNLKSVTGFSRLSKLLNKLILSNNLITGNIKIVFHYQTGKSEKALIAYPVPYNYPDDKDYRFGIKTGIIRFTRPLPEIKNWFGEFREKVGEIKKENSWYEVILENDQGLITEGSQSNIFMIRDNKIYTVPQGLILEGITRKKIIEICNLEKLNLEERNFKRDFLFSADTVFITGTSPKVLPICRINDKTFKVGHPILILLMKRYDEIIASYIKAVIDAGGHAKEK